MRSLMMFCVAVAGVGCVGSHEVLCGDAAYWSGRVADWPSDGMYVGDRHLGLDEALALLEGRPSTPRDALAAALVVAELNLAAGADDRLLPLVYEGHALLADDAEADGDALALADALSAERTCP